MTPEEYQKYCQTIAQSHSDKDKEYMEKLSKRYPKGRFTHEDAQRKGKMIDWNEDKER